MVGSPVSTGYMATNPIVVLPSTKKYGIEIILHISDDLSDCVQKEYITVSNSVYVCIYISAIYALSSLSTFSW